ncbi:hypothetical protein WMY93_020554 [Mugilogobius chulae]|uniref:TGF-beta family profile domain-containing protein n=1 Tax=Mugilogobius chulae TaxID=88201 RepID=A0AAW0NCP8_9GOBI
MAPWVFFSNLFISCVLFLFLNGLSWSSPFRPPENLRRASRERDGETVPQFVQSVSTLNLTEQKTQSPVLLPDAKEPPEYMMELYQKFAEDHAAVPSANIVRSFKNEDSSLYRDTAEGVRIYPLWFNISLPHREHIRFAELRFFFQIQQAQGEHQGPDCVVSIYHVRESPGWSVGVRQDKRSTVKEKVLEGNDLEELVTKHVSARDKGWVSFDLTNAVTQWQKRCCAEHRLEVHITNVGPKTEAKETLSKKRNETDKSSAKKHNAAIIIFSDNPSFKKDTKLNLKIEHEYNVVKNLDVSGSLWKPVSHNTHHVNQEDLKQRSLEELNSNFIYDTPSRIRRNAKSDSCRRTPLFVDFKDIGWDTWIIQPLGYEAYECKGECYPPLTSEVTPTRHALVQTLLSVKSPDRASRACCVPTKLEPISLLYHENGVITFNHKYEGMVVAECGCR